jgi:hypothetical protein
LLLLLMQLLLFLITWDKNRCYDRRPTRDDSAAAAAAAAAAALVNYLGQESHRLEAQKTIA